MYDEDSVVAVFAVEYVVRLTGLSMRQLTYWDRTGFFRPHHSSEAGGPRHSRVYSFKDVVGLRTLSLLRLKHKVSLPHLRTVAEKLSVYSKTPWADIKLKVFNRRVYWDEPDSGATARVVDGQFVLFPINDVMADVKQRAEQLTRRHESQIGQMERHRQVSHNALVIAGTRVRVATILRFHEAGYSVDDIVREYPSLTPQDVRAAIERGPELNAA